MVFFISPYDYIYKYQIDFSFSVLARRDLVPQNSFTFPSSWIWCHERVSSFFFVAPNIISTSADAGHHVHGSHIDNAAIYIYICISTQRERESNNKQFICLPCVSGLSAIPLLVTREGGRAKLIGKTRRTLSAIISTLSFQTRCTLHDPDTTFLRPVPNPRVSCLQIYMRHVATTRTISEYS